MQGKVTLEDHFAIEATLGDSQPFGSHVWSELRHRLLDFQDQRLRLMDQSGVEIMIASLNAPAIQGIADAKQAAEVAGRANDVLAAEIAKRPDRFVGVAALPMQEPEMAIQRRAGQRLFADAGPKPRAALRSAAISAVLARARKSRCSVLSAPAAAVGSLAALRRSLMAARADLELRGGNLGARFAAHRQRAVRRTSPA